MNFNRCYLLAVTFTLICSSAFADSQSGNQESKQQDLNVAEKIKDTLKTKLGIKSARKRLNINFAAQPDGAEYDGVIGSKSDYWNFIDYGQQELKNVRFGDGVPSDIEVSVTPNDGEWGIAGQMGYFHGYIYHNCRCVDLSVTLKYVPTGIYEIYVFAHGDAPDQNAAIEINSAGTLYKGKSTLNDGTMNYRDSEKRDGNQYVRYIVEVNSDTPVVITSKRDGSNYSMFNAIQMKRIAKSKSQR